jgi:hypothetical protein
VFLQGTRLSKFMESVEQVAGAMGEADADPAAEPPPAPGVVATESPAAERPQTSEADSAGGERGALVAPGKAPQTAPADPWAAILEAGAALLQGLATARGAVGSAPGSAPVTIERDPVTGQASVRLPLPDAAVLQRLAKAFEPWLR